MHSTHYTIDDNQPTRKLPKYYFKDEKENNDKMKERRLYIEVIY